ncbi:MULTISPECIES: polyphosphate--glucose phosphotransferase [Pseudonocardia]|uniref:Polyphosphate glucokinase n=2 Tax=Pseudonocardia TaxID=1847 RepID=A0A1Y2N8A9_PSEAH|nr:MULTISPECIES: ROK family protein [Pseudonocardia]OSY43168.1 Polyphosphate glucokinase [Pseudonocardia autotrophica]TDN71656.1 polyphosphate glucokinase [Pseudonocardia autotrophica]BBG02343.1 polyphosphate glucokinase [Pseudonocardia autotrophica]GEC23321.1 polyphosphate glucokinase [Pseudonocardia saturnea]
MSRKREHGFGIDIGGSGIKGAPVDLTSGKLAADRIRIPTPQPSTPEAVAGTVAEILDAFDWKGSFGCTFPAVVQHGITRTAANVDASWVDCDAGSVLRKVTGRDALLVNDADAAGVAEVEFGAAGAASGVVLLATLGTGIGTAVISHGHLVPNTELGHLEIDGHDAESRAADSAREREDLSWEEWGGRLTRYFQHVENLLWPDLIVVGGGVSKKFDKWSPYVSTRTPMVPAKLLNEAGIIGAALLAHD